MDNIFRPYYLKDFVGKDSLKNNLDIYIKAAIKRKECLDHVLLYGPGGLGKTSIGYIISHEMKTNLRYISAPSIEKIGDLAAILSTINAGDILFIDEIHRLPKNVEEILYSAMEDFKFNVLINNNLETRNLEVSLPPFTLVGATTKKGLLSNPLRDRFPIQLLFDYYGNQEIADIIKCFSNLFKIELDEETALFIAERSRGTPRVAINFMKRLRDYCTVKNLKKLDIKNVSLAFENFGIDKLGLDYKDNNYISTLYSRFNGGPVGVKAIATTMNEDLGVVEEVIEPFLLRIGLINRTIKGRVLTKEGILYIKNK